MRNSILVVLWIGCGGDLNLRHLNGLRFNVLGHRIVKEKILSKSFPKVAILLRLL